MQKLRTAALVLTVMAILVCIAAYALMQSLPYRIGPDQYSRYLWTGPLVITALVMSLFAVCVGALARSRLAIILPILSSLLFVLILPGGPHSGPNPEAWCYNNLRQIDAAKNQIALEKGLTNGDSITADQISKLLGVSFSDLKCAKHGQYEIGPVGSDPRCTVHGSITEMQAEWQKPNKK
jgi:hypothetical protein